MYIKVRVTPGARDKKFEKVKNDTYHIAVKEKAEMNMANKKVISLLSEHLGVSANRLRLISGHHSLSKIFSVQY